MFSLSSGGNVIPALLPTHEPDKHDTPARLAAGCVGGPHDRADTHAAHRAELPHQLRADSQRHIRRSIRVSITRYRYIYI